MDTNPDSARSTLLSGIDIGALLDALDGWAYLLDTHGIVVAVGASEWDAFSRDNGRPELAAGQVVGRDLFEQIAGAEVRAVYSQMHEALVSGRRREITFNYRCDAPDKERHMRLSMSAVSSAGATVAILYQSQLTWEASRPPMGLFKQVGRPHLRAESILSMCSFCHDVAWPVGAADPDREWIEPTEYYRRGGADDVAISHGMCPPCHERFLAAI